MESALSEEEFHRMQLQLIELKTEKYQLEDKCKKQDNTLKDLQTRHDNLEKEYQRSVKAVNKSKKAREVDMLIKDNESLERKLHNQEEEFRLQNDTLMKELAMFATKNDELEMKLTQTNSSQSDHVDSAEMSRLQNEVTRLQAENSALQKNIDDVKNKFESELKLLRSAVDSVDITDSAPGTAESSDTSSLTNLIHESEALSQINELKVLLDTEREEKGLLQSRLNELEKNVSLEALAQLKDKLKKKQESFTQIQQEKEQQFTELTQKITNLEESRHRDSNNFRTQIEKLNEEIRINKQTRDEAEVKLRNTIGGCETTISALKSKINESSQKILEQLRVDNERMKEEISQKTSQIAELQAALSSTQGSLTETEQSLKLKQEELGRTSKSKDETEQKLSAISQTAEKRKKLLDELAIKSQQDSDSYKTKLADMEASRKQEIAALVENHRSEMSEMKTELRHEQLKAADLEKYKQDLESLQEEIRRLEEAKDELQRSLSDTERVLSGEREKFEREITEAEESRRNNLEQIEEEHQSRISELSEKIESQESSSNQKVIEIEILTQKINDNTQVMKLHEKKGASLMKDLKKQLVQERRRADKLDKRLEEVLTEAKIRQPAEAFNLPNDLERVSLRADDTSSVSSWSAANFNGSLAFTNTSSNRTGDIPNMESTPRGSPIPHEHELNTLLPLVTSLQKEKAMLSERVSMLETSNSAMADDLIQKQAIIDHYSMHSKERMSPMPQKSRHGKDDAVSLKQIVNFVKNKGDDSLKEKLRITQRMLEETLTKNMNLQRDMEMLASQMSAKQSDDPPNPQASGAEQSSKNHAASQQ